MNPVVIYSTKNGNTEKVALEITQELNCKAIKISGEADLSTMSIKDFDLVIIGTWIRGGEPSPDMTKFLKQLNFEDCNRAFALFMTWAGGGISDVLTFKHVKQLLEAKNQTLLDDSFKCLGKTFGLVRRGHPDAQDLTNARKWARKLDSAPEKYSEL
jgi:flavodoxin